MSQWDSETLPQPTRSPEVAKRDIDQWGYAILLDLISPDETRRLRDALDEQGRLEREQGVAFLGDGGRGGSTWVGSPRNGVIPPWQAVRTLVNKGRPFIDLMMNPKLHEMQQHVFDGHPYYLSSLTGLILRKGARPLVTHIDQGMVPFQTPIPVGANTMVTLTEFSDANGATRVVPGSHRGPPPRIEMNFERMDGYNPDEIESVPVEAPPGSGIIFESRTWHSAGSSVSDMVRYSITTFFVMPFMRGQDNHPASLHDEVYAGLSEEERAMIGFRTGPFGRIDPRYPGDRSNTDIENPYVPELRDGSPARAIPVAKPQSMPSYSDRRDVSSLKEPGGA